MKNVLISFDQENTNVDNIKETVLSATIKSDSALSVEECLISVCMIYKCLSTQTEITKKDFSEAVFSYLDKVQFEENKTL